MNIGIFTDTYYRIKNVVKKLSRHCCDNAECVIVPTDKVKNLLHS